MTPGPIRGQLPHRPSTRSSKHGKPGGCGSTRAGRFEMPTRTSSSKTHRTNFPPSWNRRSGSNFVLRRDGQYSKMERNFGYFGDRDRKSYLCGDLPCNGKPEYSKKEDMMRRGERVCDMKTPVPVAAAPFGSVYHLHPIPAAPVALALSHNHPSTPEIIPPKKNTRENEEIDTSGGNGPSMPAVIRGALEGRLPRRPYAPPAGTRTSQDATVHNCHRKKPFVPVQ